MINIRKNANIGFFKNLLLPKILFIREFEFLCDFCLPEVFWDSQFSARPERQSVSMTKDYQVHSQLYYVRCHMPGEGSIVRGNRRLPESPNSLQIQEMCETHYTKTFTQIFF